MFCRQCGNQIDDDSKFCAFCGYVTSSGDVFGSDTSGSIKKKKKTGMIIPIIAAAILCIGGVLFAILFNTAEARASRQLQTAKAYLDEMDYEMAIASYKKVIEIDPKNADAYLGIALAYRGQDRDDMAIDILIDGYQNVAAEELLLQLEIIVSKNVNTYVKQGDYEGAIALIEDVQRKLGFSFMQEEIMRLKDQIARNESEGTLSFSPDILPEEESEHNQTIEEAELRELVEYGLEHNAGLYIKDLFAGTVEPAETVRWINSVQGTFCQQPPSPYALVPYETIVWNGGSGYVSAAVMQDRCYFATGYRPRVEELDAGGDYFMSEGELLYWVVTAYGPDAITELSNPLITEINGDLCTVQFDALSYFMTYGEELQDEDIYFSGLITLTLQYDPESAYDNLRLVGAGIDGEF